MGVDEVGKLGVGNGFIRKLSESGEVGTEFLELAIKVGGGFKDSKHFVLRSLCHCHVLAFWLFFSHSHFCTKLDVHKLSTTLGSFFLDIWFDILLTMNSLLKHLRLYNC